MLLEKPGESIVIGEKTYTVGVGIVGIKDEYAGLTGYIAEIRDGAEKLKMRRWIFTAALMSQRIQTKSKNLRRSFLNFMRRPKPLRTYAWIWLLWLRT